MRPEFFYLRTHSFRRQPINTQRLPKPNIISQDELKSDNKSNDKPELFIKEPLREIPQQVPRPLTPFPHDIRFV